MTSMFPDREHTRPLAAFARGLTAVVVAGALSVAPLAAQTDFPTPPANWWTNLNDNGFPTATIEVNPGFPMIVTQSIQSIEGSNVTLSTGGTVMGTAMPPQSQTVDVAAMTTEDAVAMFQQGIAGGRQGGAAAAPVGITVRKIEDAQCTVGTLTLACGIYDVTVQGTIIRAWHAPAIPPVFMGGIVRAESTLAGQQLVITMQSYRGRLIR